MEKLLQILDSLSSLGDHGEQAILDMAGQDETVMMVVRLYFGKQQNLKMEEYLNSLEDYKKCLVAKNKIVGSSPVEPKMVSDCLMSPVSSSNSRAERGKSNNIEVSDNSATTQRRFNKRRHNFKPCYKE